MRTVLYRIVYTCQQKLLRSCTKLFLTEHSPPFPHLRAGICCCTWRKASSVLTTTCQDELTYRPTDTQTYILEQRHTTDTQTQIYPGTDIVYWRALTTVIVIRDKMWWIVLVKCDSRHILTRFVILGKFWDLVGILVIEDESETILSKMAIESWNQIMF